MHFFEYDTAQKWQAYSKNFYSHVICFLWIITITVDCSDLVAKFERMANYSLLASWIILSTSVEIDSMLIISVYRSQVLDVS